MSDDALPGMDTAGAGGKAGAVRAAVVAAVEAAQLDDRDKGTGALAIACAAAVDVALTTRRDPYAVASAARELRETLTRLRMDPVSREGNDAGQVQTWLDQLGAT